MVRVSFIVEGDTEKIIIESAAFMAWARASGIEICSPVINAKGGGNLLPQNMAQIVMQAKRANPDHIVILTDLEDAPNGELVRNRIGTEHTSLIFIAVKAIEAWFLADTAALRSWLGMPDAFEERPEETPGMPWERLKAVAQEKDARGPGSNKLGFAKRLCRNHGFTIPGAAAHPACPSAKLFHDGVAGLGQLDVAAG